MSFRFELAYLIGFTPWDRRRGKPPRPLRELIEGPKALRPGRALDLGCGTGSFSVYLAQRGWKVTGIDAVERALGIARSRAARTGLGVDFVHGDITDLDSAGLNGRFDLFLDMGCFHNLSEEARKRYGESLTRFAAANARLILFAFGRNRDVLAPRGAAAHDIERSVAPAWSIVSSVPENGVPYRVPRGTPAIWYLLSRGGALPIPSAAESAA